jgi:hypothetical protein
MTYVLIIKMLQVRDWNTPIEIVNLPKIHLSVKQTDFHINVYKCPCYSHFHKYGNLPHEGLMRYINLRKDCQSNFIIDQSLHLVNTRPLKNLFDLITVNHFILPMPTT